MTRTLSIRAPCLSRVMAREAGLAEEGAGIGGGDGAQRITNRGDHGLPGARPDATQPLLRLGKGLLDGIEVGGGGRHEDHPTAGGFDERAGFGAFMDVAVVPDNDLPARRLGTKISSTNCSQTRWSTAPGSTTRGPMPAVVTVASQVMWGRLPRGTRPMAR